MYAASAKVEFRQAVHSLLAAVLYYTGFLNLNSWFRRRILNRHEIAVIGLHRVLTVEEAHRSLCEPSMVLLLPSFQSLLKTLRKHYRIVGLNDLASFADGDLSRPLCMITFDDGWCDTFENARAALKNEGVPAVLFVATGRLDSKDLFWVERLARVWKLSCESENLTLASTTVEDLAGAIAALKELPAVERERIVASLESRCTNPPTTDAVDTFMTWKQLLACAEEFEIGSHTVTHPLLTHEDSTVVDRELADSKSELELRLRRKVSAFAYPSGDHNAWTMLAVEESGYSFAFTTEKGRFRSGDSHFAIPRVLLHEGNLAGITGKFSAARLHLRLMGWG